MEQVCMPKRSFIEQKRLHKSFSTTGEQSIFGNNYFPVASLPYLHDQRLYPLMKERCFSRIY